MPIAPTLLNVYPMNSETDVVLGANIELTFSEPINTSSVSVDTFILQGPGDTTEIGPEQLISVKPLQGKGFILGTFLWDTDKVKLTFKPRTPFQPNTAYTVMIVGTGGSITPNAVLGQNGIQLDKTYKWSFTTGDLDVSTPPVQSPIQQLRPQLNPADIVVKVSPRLKTVGNDLSQEIDIVFPAPIDRTTFNIEDLNASIDSILNDIYVRVPEGLITTAIVSSDLTTIKVTITGWPPDYDQSW